MIGNEISSVILSIWEDTEKSLRKDNIGRELFKELLKGVYIKLENE